MTADVSGHSSQYRDSERDEMRRQTKIRQMTASFLHSGPSSQGVKCSIIGDVVNKLLAAHNNSLPRSSKVTLVIRVGDIIHHRHRPGMRATIMVSTPGLLSQIASEIDTVTLGWGLLSPPHHIKSTTDTTGSPGKRR